MPFLEAAMIAAPLLGKIFGGAGKGASDQRMSENDQRLRQAQMTNQYNLSSAGLQSSDNMNRARVDLDRREFQQREPGAQARQAMVGSLLNRIQPLRLSGLSSRVQASMPQMNSIIDAIGPEARQAGSLLAQRGLSGLESGPTQFSEIPALNIPPAQMAALQKSGLLEKILGTVGLIGSGVGALDAAGALNGRPTSGNGLPIDPYGGG